METQPQYQNIDISTELLEESRYFENYFLAEKSKWALNVKSYKLLHQRKVYNGIDIQGGTEWLLIALVVLLLFGGKKIPELMRGLGKGVSEFKKGKKEVEKDLED